MNKKGFTLIELLVVVLIIGILSAVALPQYQKTVLKSRTAEAWTNLSALNKAVQAYCLENPSESGTYSSYKDSFPIQVDNSGNFSYGGDFTCSYTDPVIGITASYARSGSDFVLGISDSGKRLCSGSGCADIGFVKTGGVSCHCGMSCGACYYMD